MRFRGIPVLLLVAATAVAACGPPASPVQQQDEGASDKGRAAATMPQRTLVVIGRAEPPSLAARPLVDVGGGLAGLIRPFNAMLDHTDEREVTHPYLAEALPQLNTDTWRVFADGRMETTYKLKPNLTWQDGVALTAEDFVFGWRVYSNPEMGTGRSDPFRQMEEVAAPDPRTVVIRWRGPYPLAAEMDVDFQALPRHILEASFESALGGDPAGFVHLPFWTFEYLGLGPYRVEHWEAGAFLEATAFDGHALGRPKIDRLRMTFIGDPNTALANMLSGDAHYVAAPLMGYEDGATLEREWSARGGKGGTVFFAPVLIRFSMIQHRPEYVSPKALLDVRVRRALAYAFDTPGALEVFTGGRGVITHTMSSPRASYYPTVERVITRRDYDPRTAQRLLEEAGMVRGADGFYVSATGEPFKMELWNTGGAVFERENALFVDGLRQAGIDASGHALGPTRIRDSKFRALLPALFTSGAGVLTARLRLLAMSDIPEPDNHWQGRNRGGWVNADYERLWQAYNSTLERSERFKQIAEMERLNNENVGTIPHYYTVLVDAHTANLEGPAVRMTPDAPLSIYHIQNWRWRE